MKRSIAVPILTAIALLAVALQANAAGRSRAPESSCSANHWRTNDLANYAESREQRLASASENYINPGQNGSIKVHGWNSSDVLVRACVQASAPSESEAHALASQVVIANGPGRIEPSGPDRNDNQYWGVSYEVWVPHSSNLRLEAFNGGIAVDNVHGELRFHTLNGSVRLREMSGDVDGSTTNGSVAVDFSGTGWQGRGLRVETTNGSVNLNVPENFSAQVEASTVNGSVRTDFPITISGDIKHDLSFTLGSGGATVAARTVNGSVHIGRA